MIIVIDKVVKKMNKLHINLDRVQEQIIPRIELLNDVSMWADYLNGSLKNSVLLKKEHYDINFYNVTAVVSIINNIGFEDMTIDAIQNYLVDTLSKSLIKEIVRVVNDKDGSRIVVLANDNIRLEVENSIFLNNQQFRATIYIKNT